MVINEGAKDNLVLDTTKPMGYILDLEKELEQRLTDLEEEKKKELINFVKCSVLESYKNGIMAAKIVKAGKEAERKTRKFSKG